MEVLNINNSMAKDVSLLEFLDGCENTLFYTQPSFVSLLEKHLNASGGWILVKDNGCLIGAMPYLVKDGPFGCIVNSMAFYGSNGGIIQPQNNPAVGEVILREFDSLIDKLGVCCATIIPNPLVRLGALESFDYTYKDERIGQFTFNHNLASKEELIATFANPRPRNIRKAMNSGIKIELSKSKEAIEFLSRTHKENMLAIGGLPKEQDFFYSIPNSIPDNKWNIFLAKKDQENVAGLLVFYHGQTVEYFTPAVVGKYRSFQPLSLIILEAMYDAYTKGFTNWNWGATWLTQKGVYDFKKKWNTEDRQYFYLTRVINNDILSASEADLLRWYKGFFVVPFKYLDNGKSVS